MGWLSNLFKKENPTQTQYAEVTSGYAPIFSQFGQDIYASDVVQQAINCIVQEIKKLLPEHVRKHGQDIEPVNSSLQMVLNNPNPIMTTSEFLEKVTWLLFLNYNAFIIPTYTEVTDKNGKVHKQYDGLYPILPSQVHFLEDKSGKLYVTFRFNNGQEYTVKYSDVIHLKYRYSVNQYMGGNESGQPDNDALLKTLDINHQLLQGVASAMKSSFAINGVIKYNTMLDEGKTEAALKELESKLKKSESGFLPLDLKAEYIPIKKELQLVDKNTLEFIDTKILRHYGVSLPILLGDYTKEQYEAFFQKTCEPLIASFSQAFTKVLFTDKEKGFGNQIKFFAKDLLFMSMDQKIAVLKELAPTGTLFENEKRVMFGWRPLPELVGKRYQSLNWVDANKANEYQIGKEDDTGGGDNGQENDNQSV